MVADFPDWSRVSSGTLRYLGSVSRASVGVASITVTITPSERSLYIYVPGFSFVTNITVSALTAGVTMGVLQFPTAGIGNNVVPGAVIVNYAIDTQYVVQIGYVSGSGTAIAYVFGSSDMAAPSNQATPLFVTLSNGSTSIYGPQPAVGSIPVVIAGDTAAGRSGIQTGANSLPVVLASDSIGGTVGQKTMAASAPVVIASDQSSLPVTINSATPAGASGQKTMAASAPVVIASDQSSLPVTINAATAAGRSGQQTGANSLPVVLPTDTFSLGYGARKPYDQMTVNAPAANTAALVTFAATAGRRWVIDYVSCVVFSGTGQAVSVNVTLLDGATTIWGDTLEMTNAVNNKDRTGFGPNAGFVGTSGGAMTVNIPAPGAGAACKITAAGYLLPAGV